MTRHPASEALAGAIAQAADAVLLVTDGDGTILDESSSWNGFVGADGPRVGARFLEATHPEDRAHVLAAWTEGVARGVAFELEQRVRRPAGRFTRGRTRAVPVAADARPGAPASPRGTWVLAHTEVWSDASVRESEQRLRLATEAAGVAVWEYDFVAGQMTRTANHDGLYGLEPQAVWQYDLFVGATHPEDRAVADRHVQASVAPGGPDDYSFDFRVVWPDASVHWLAVSGHVVSRDPAGVATLVRGALVDVTRLKQVEHELRDAVRELEQNDRRKNEFLAMLAHELRNPMSAIWFALSLLRNAGADPVASERALTVMDRQMRHLRRLVDDLLDIARLSRGKLTLQLEPLDLNDAVRRAVDAAPAGDRRHELSVSYGPVLRVRGDATRLEQIVLNLVTNARKYTDEGGRIHVGLAADGGDAVLTVSDSGIGIPPDQLESVFEPFVQVSSTIDRAQGGLGLGLALVRELARLHGGRVRAESELGRGTTLVVSLPLADG